MEPTSTAAVRANARKVAEVGYGVFNLTDPEDSNFGRTYADILAKAASREYHVTHREFWTGDTAKERFVYVEWLELYLIDRREVSEFVTGSRVRHRPKPEDVGPQVIPIQTAMKPLPVAAAEPEPKPVKRKKKQTSNRPCLSFLEGKRQP